MCCDISSLLKEFKTNKQMIQYKHIRIYKVITEVEYYQLDYKERSNYRVFYGGSYNSSVNTHSSTNDTPLDISYFNDDSSSRSNNDSSNDISSGGGDFGGDGSSGDW